MNQYMKITVVIMTASTATLCTPNKPNNSGFSSYAEQAFNWSRVHAEVVNLTGQRHVQIGQGDTEAERIDTCWTEAINAFVSCMDPHSGFLAPKAYQEIIRFTSGKFGGIGVVIDNTRQPKDSSLTVIDIVPGGPAEIAGVLPLDKIVEIDGHLLEGMTTEEAMAKLKGKPGTTVDVKIMREKFPDLISLTITRDIIKEQNSLCFYLPEQQIYYVALTTFTTNAMSQIESLLKKSDHHPYKGLILDLRNNSGGLLEAAIDIVGMFVPSNSLVVQTKGTGNKKLQEYRTTREPIVTKKLPIFILINNYTASAGEILAGCLQLHEKAFLLGTRTFGKGSVQEIIPVGNNCAIKLTTALYYLPGDVSIQAIGIEPDFVVERMLVQTEHMKWFTKSHGRESAQQNYITTEMSKKHTETEKEQEKAKKDMSKHKKWAERGKEALEQDNQFKAALMLINMLDAAQACTPDKVNTRAKAKTYLKKLFCEDGPISMQEVKN
jgi:carboxyl-terminal processing protease